MAVGAGPAEPDTSRLTPTGHARRDPRPRRPGTRHRGDGGPALDTAGTARHSPGQPCNAGKSAVIDWIIRLFAWWHGTTYGTSFTTWLRGEFVGEDEFGNRYYRTRGGKIDPALALERRWVIYKGLAEPSMIPPGWYGWMHHKMKLPPTEEPFRTYEWQKPHLPNLSGTRYAYRPKGSVLNPDPDAAVTTEYDAWTPG